MYNRCMSGHPVMQVCSTFPGQTLPFAPSTYPAMSYKDLTHLVSHLPDENAAAGALAARDSVTFEAVFPGIIAFIQQCAQ